MSRPSLESRTINYLQSANFDTEGNVTIQGPTGIRVFVPPTQPQSQTDPREQTPEDYAGRYQPILRGRVVFGPQPKRFFPTICVFIVLLVIFSLQSNDVMRDCGGPYVVLLGFSLLLVTFLAYVLICLNDPGVIPDNYTLRELITETEPYRERNPDSRFYRYCLACRGFRPPRSKHCELCDICIRDHETHLFVGGTCIGQRTSRSLLILSVGVGCLTFYTIIVNSIILNKASPQLSSWGLGFSITSLVLGVLLLFTPQLGIILFIFRVYLIGSGYTGSSFIHRKTEWIACPLDNRSAVKHYTHFFFGKKAPSVFSKSRRVEPEMGSEQDEAAADWEALLSLPDQGLPLLQELMMLRGDDNEGRCILLRNNLDAYNNNVERDGEDEERLKNLAASARTKLIPSDPQLQDGDLEPVKGQKMGLRSRVCDILYQKITEFQKPRNLSKSGIVTQHRVSSSTLSEGSIPYSKEETQRLVTTARAEQFRRLIQLILTRDREGLLEMGRTVNIPALLGVEHFDPDNYQFIELSNGLPMLAQRRRNANPNMRFTGLLGIPQMVAAGLLPPARKLAQDMESVMGAGSIRRVANQNNNHVTYQRTTPVADLPRNYQPVTGRQRPNRVVQLTSENASQNLLNAPMPRREHNRSRSRTDRPLEVSSGLPTAPNSTVISGINRRPLRDREHLQEQSEPSDPTLLTQSDLDNNNVNPNETI